LCRWKTECQNTPVLVNNVHQQQNEMPASK
jgi:hypothetical protein